MDFKEIAEITASIIVSLGGGGGIVFGMSGYLGRVWADRSLEKQRHENAQLNIQLKNQLALINDERKHLLQLRQTEHEIRLSKLYEKRAQVIADLYEKFVVAYWAAHTYHQGWESPGGPTPEEQANSAVKSLHEAYRFFEVTRIYLSDPLSNELDTFFDKAKMLTLKVSYFDFQSDKNKTERTLQMGSEARIESLEAFQKEFPALRKKLDKEFKKLVNPKEDAD